MPGKKKFWTVFSCGTISTGRRQEKAAGREDSAAAEGEKRLNRLDLIYRSELPHRAVAVYMYLQGRANKDGQCWPALRTISRDLKLSVRTVQRGITDLKQAGYLETEQRYRQSGTKSSLLFTVRK